MDDIRFTCSACGQRLEAPDDLAGETIECPSCGAGITVPAPAPAEEAESETGLSLAGKKDAHSCPKCGASMDKETVLCLKCGFHTALGKKLETEIS